MLLDDLENQTMPRIVVPYEADKTIFTTQIPILVNHLSYGAHLGNEHILSFATEVRIRWLNQFGLTELNLGDDIGLVIGDVCINYKAEGFHGELLTIELYPDELKKHSFQLYYRFSKQTDNTTVALLKTGQVFFDFEHRKLTQAPQSFAALFEVNFSS